MAKRKEYKYSIISYNQNSLRNESINIGLLIFNENTYKYKIIPNNSSKINGLAYSQYFKELFKENVKVVNYALKNGTATSLDQLNKISQQIQFSSFRKIITSNINTIFSTLLDEYVGNYYLNSRSTSETVTAKQLALNIFSKNKVLNTKVSKNVRVKPNRDLNMRINIDFAFANGNNLNLINSVPASEASIDDWYSKMFLLTEKFEQSGEILLLSNSSNTKTKSEEVSDVLNDLASNKRVKALDLAIAKDLNSFNKYVKKIQDSDSSEEKINSLIARANIA
ncbi:hypothetical protein [Limosilactobacillus galli]|uniref:hypothetical protein n=1 Tax=Limosilactobacillus galli TaxID=2991834 RepID=UPI0024BA2014|nr:hypothetical protein [Limosilactobacillus galli]